MDTPGPGSRIGPYEVLEAVAGGGFGRVFRARHAELERTLLLKVLLHKENEHVRRFVREARVLARIASPHVMPILDAGLSGDVVWLATPDTQAVDLTAWTASPAGAAAPLATRLGVLLDVVRGLKDVHAAGVLHRDVKPANILVLPDGSAQIADLGLSLDAEETRLTGVDRMVGTVTFMPPEVLAGADADARTDLYQWALTAYWLLAGELPYAEDGPAESALRRCRDGAPPIARARPDLPSPIADLVDRNLAIDRDLRHRAATELEEDLAPHVDALRGPPRERRVPRRPARPLPSRPPERSAWLPAMLALVVGALALLAPRARVAPPPPPAPASPALSIQELEAEAARVDALLDAPDAARSAGLAAAIARLRTYRASAAALAARVLCAPGAAPDARVQLYHALTRAAHLERFCRVRHIACDLDFHAIDLCVFREGAAPAAAAAIALPVPARAKFLRADYANVPGITDTGHLLFLDLPFTVPPGAPPRSALLQLTLSALSQELYMEARLNDRVSLCFGPPPGVRVIGNRAPLSRAFDPALLRAGANVLSLRLRAFPGLTADRNVSLVSARILLER